MNSSNEAEQMLFELYRELLKRNKMKASREMDENTFTELVISTVILAGAARTDGDVTQLVRGMALICCQFRDKGTKDIDFLQYDIYRNDKEVTLEERELIEAFMRAEFPNLLSILAQHEEINMTGPSGDRLRFIKRPLN